MEAGGLLLLDAEKPDFSACARECHPHLATPGRFNSYDKVPFRHWPIGHPRGKQAIFLAWHSLPNEGKPILLFVGDKTDQKLPLTFPNDNPVAGHNQCAASVIPKLVCPEHFPRGDVVGIASA
jgi:hypothetical protein